MTLKLPGTLIIVFLLAFVFSAKVFSHPGKTSYQNNHLSEIQVVSSEGDSLLQLNIIMENGVEVLQVSFNGNGENIADFKIFNSSKVMVYKEYMELIRSPNYSSISLQNFSPGIYSVQLQTKEHLYMSTFIIE